MKETVKFVSWVALAVILLAFYGASALGTQSSSVAELPNFDQRLTAPVPPTGSNTAVARLRTEIPDAQVHFDAIVGSPRWVTSPSGFLTGPGGTGAAISPATLSQFATGDSNRIVRAFLQQHRELFGHGPEALDTATIKREVVNAGNGLRTTVLEQQLDGISVFEALLIAHVTARGELVSLSSHFVPSPAPAADANTSNRPLLESAPPISSLQALLNAAQNIGENISPRDTTALPPENSPERRQSFCANALKGNAVVRLVWLPMSRDSLRLCWEVLLMSRARSEMYRVLIDAQTGTPLVRQCLTENLSNASYRVFTSFNPTPFLSPSNSLPTVMGYSSPQTNQPAEVARVLVVTNAFDTNASPLGWINDSNNTTAGNNVLAQADRDGTDPPNPVRPTGSPFRVFDFPLDLTQDPVTYTNASVVNLFYWCNWMHDRLYELGFTEAAGNFQSTNFGRGGVQGDPVSADAQDGDGINNAHFTTLPDGMPGLMQIYLFNGPTPIRDADFDNEIIKHEYTHGMSNRRVGGGVGISALQSLGLGEGWSDFFSLALSTQATDDPNACYPESPYAAYFLNGQAQNYYFGIRRYPYSTSLTNCPGTFADIDPTQASSHSGVPLNPAITNASASEIHNQGEIWCDALWDARANLISSYGFATGNQLILQLVANGMDLTPANPDFVEARDAIIQADLVNSGGQNYQALWRAFAKRGLGWYAVAPPSSTTAGVVESYVVPDTLWILPAGDFITTGNVGGPFNPAYELFALKNTGTNSLTWTCGVNVPWVDLSASNGVLPGLTSFTNISVSLDPIAATFQPGIYLGTLSFTNVTTGFVQTRNLALTVSPSLIYFFSLDTDPGWSRQGQWAFGQPTGQGGTQHGFPDPTSGATGQNVFGVNLNGDYTADSTGPYYLTTAPLDFTGVQNVMIEFQRWLNTDFPPYAFADVSVSADGTNWTTIFSNDGGPVTDSAWTNCIYDISSIADNQPAVQVRWGYQATTNAFLYSGWNIDDIGFLGSNQLYVALPPSTTEGAGVLTGQGQVAIPHPAVGDVNIMLGSSDPNTISVPGTITISSGQTNAHFDLTSMDDGLLDGTRPVQITASASGCVSGTNSITVFDIETAVLGVSLQATATEGDGSIPGTVSINATPDADISVSLSSTDPNLLSVPPIVVVPAGQTNVAFNANVGNPGRINGSENVTVTAHVQNWTDGNDAISIQYLQSSNLTLILPAQARESNGLLTNAGSISIAGTLSTNLVVSLFSSNTAKLLLPASVAILAGQTSAVFNLTTVSGNPPSAPIMVGVAATAPGFTPAAAAINIIDNQTPPAPFAPYPPNLSTNIPVNADLSWSAGLGEGVENVLNGGFESGSFNNWNPSTNVVINNGSVSPPSGDGVTAPYDGNFSALADPTPPAASVLYQDILLPTNTGTITLSWVDRIRNFAADFQTNQQFRVEIRNTNNTTLATVYSSQPGDPLLNDWVQRSANISSFAGQTIRLTFIVNASSNFLDVHLDDVSVRWANLPPVTYAVYFGTDSTPGPSDFVGNTTNTSWSLPQLTPFVTYYWQIVANRSNQTAGPIWQFSTLPTLVISNASLANNTNGISNIVFSVSLSSACSNLVSVDFTTVDGTAVAPGDYIATNGTLFFNPGVTNQTIPVGVNFNTNLPAIKTFTLSLSNPTNAALGNTNGLGTINNSNPLAPVVAAISNRTIHAQTTLSLVATATNVNNDPMLFSLDPGAPPSAVIGATNGVFSWTPADTNLGLFSITVRATDVTVPSLSGTASFMVNVVPRPTFNSVKYTNGQVTLGWSAIVGDAYRLQTKTNIFGVWTNVPGDVTATNTIATKVDSSAVVRTRFYRILILP